MATLATTNLPPKGGWRVGTQVSSIKRNAQGQSVNGMTVHFVTGYGVSSTVWLPNATYNAKNVRQAISAKVAELDGVSTLKFTGPGT
jgi:hypothetical protein